MPDLFRAISKQIKLLSKIESQYRESAEIPKDVLELIADMCWDILGVVNRARGKNVSVK